MRGRACVGGLHEKQDYVGGGACVGGGAYMRGRACVGGGAW